MMKIQDHASFPPIPFISAIPRASKPPKAPAAVAAEKKMAIRNPHSWRLYHRVMLGWENVSYVLHRVQETGHKTDPSQMSGWDDLLIRHTGEQAAFSETEEETAGHQAAKIANETHARADYTPGNLAHTISQALISLRRNSTDHDRRNPDGWPEAFHHKVGRDLC
jgi:hypothetical protein